jgi:CopG family nickel-responsive transcriptional regulator
MSQVTRTAVSLPADLLGRFDRYLSRRGYDNRSEAIRDLIREELSEEALTRARTPAVGIATIVYAHEERQLPHRLTQLEHRHAATVVSTVHVHLDEHQCLEVVVLRGRSAEVQALGHRLVSERGVRYGRLFLAAVEGALP